MTEGILLYKLSIKTKKKKFGSVWKLAKYVRL